MKSVKYNLYLIIDSLENYQLTDGKLKSRGSGGVELDGVQLSFAVRSTEDCCVAMENWATCITDVNSKHLRPVKEGRTGIYIVSCNWPSPSCHGN